MTEFLAPELKMFRDKFQHFLNENINLNAQAMRSKSIEKGFYSISHQSTLHDGPANALEMVIARESVASSGILDHSNIIGPDPGALMNCSDEIKNNYLDPMLKGDKKASFAFTENDFKNPTTAELIDSQVIINGKKSYVSRAVDSDFMLVVLNFKPDNSRFVAIVDSNSEGISLNQTFESLDGSTHSEVTFDNVQIPQNLLLKNVQAATQNILQERLEMSAISVGLAIFTVNELTANLLKPHRSGASLSDREGIRLKYSDLRINTYAARSMLYRTATLLEGYENVINEVTATKIFCTETAFNVVDTAIQLSGGESLIVGNHLEAIFRKTRSMKLAGGSNEILRLNISKGIFEFDSGTL